MKEEMRKIVQLASSAPDDLSALCNDGTVWYLTSKGWWKLKWDIPQHWEEPDNAS